MAGQKWTIYWNEYSSDAFLYGSRILYHKRDDVEYRNHLLPIGAIINQWYSKTNYQMQRIEPSLPMIDGESEYQMVVNITCPEGEECFVRLVFYDRYDEEAGSFAIRGREASFRCPLKTYYYKLQLINGGVTHFHFHWIEIRELTDGTEKTFEKTI